MVILHGALIGDIFHCRGCGLCWQDANHHKNLDARVCPECHHSLNVAEMHTSAAHECDNPECIGNKKRMQELNK